MHHALQPCSARVKGLKHGSLQNQLKFAVSSSAAGTYPGELQSVASHQLQCSPHGAAQCVFGLLNTTLFSSVSEGQWTIPAAAHARGQRRATCLLRTCLYKDLHPVLQRSAISKSAVLTLARYQRDGRRKGSPAASKGELSSRELQ